MDATLVPRESLRKTLDAFPRCRLAYLPTPLEPLERLSARYGVNLFIKREDLTGLAFGGNKSRKIDFVMADVVAQRADSIITWAGVQSNWCRQLTAAACKLRVRPVLLLFKRRGLPRDIDGNLLLDWICGAEIHTVELASSHKMSSLDGIGDLIAGLVEKESSAGRTSYVVPIGASLVEGSMRKPLGAIAYVSAFLEMLEQMEARKALVDAVVLATGSGSTHAGLAVGAGFLSPQTKVVAVSISDSRDEILPCTRAIAHQTWIEFGGASERKFGSREGDLILFDDYIGDGYGIPNRETIETVRLLAHEEGILLDPVYTGKAFTALLALIESGYFRKGQNIVFMHTGGTPAIFPYRDAFRKYLFPDEPLEEIAASM